jgi:hypothetical protein
MAPSHHLSLARQPKRLWIVVRFCAALVLPLAVLLLHLRWLAQM